MKYLVTGGAGFVGSHLVDSLLADGHTVYVVDNLSNGSRENVPLQARFFNMNVRDITPQFFSHEKFDGIFHLATAPRSSSLQDPITDIETNLKGILAVLELAKAHGSKVVFTSNSGIYGAGVGIDESFPNKPTTPYDVTKLASEYYCRIYHDIHGVHSCIVRFATVYGPRQKVNEALNWRPLVATLLKNVTQGETVTINGDGQQTRDLLYVKDAVHGVRKAMDSEIHTGDVMLLSTDTEHSVHQVLDVVERATLRIATKTQYTPPLKGDIRRMRYSYRKASELIGYSPKYTLAQGVREMITSLKEKST